jgi:hypothetical protein
LGRDAGDTETRGVIAMRQLSGSSHRWRGADSPTQEVTEPMSAQTDPLTAGHLHAAIAELIQLDAARAATERTERAGIKRLIRLTDVMIEQLELENLRGVVQVSGAWGPRLALLCATLPIDCRRRLHGLGTPAQVLDLVFDVQACLLALKRSRRVDATVSVRGAFARRRPLAVEVSVLRRPGVHRVPVRVA